MHLSNISLLMMSSSNTQFFLFVELNMHTVTHTYGLVFFNFENVLKCLFYEILA